MPHSILFLNWKDIKHPRAGGGTLYTHKIMTYLCRKGYEVTLLTAKYCGAKDQEAIDGVRILRLGNKYTVYSRAAFKYLKDMKRHFDIVIDEINYIPWFTPLYIVDTPILGFIHQTGQGLLVFEVGHIPGTLLRYLERITPLLYRNIPTVTVSESVKEELVQSGFSPTKVIVIPPGIDVEKYRVKLSERADYPLILYVGRLTRYKGIEHLIRAVHYLSKEMPDLQVSIVGKGDYLKDLVKLRDSLGLQQDIKFHGYVSEREKIRLMQKARLLINPSVKEGFSIVVIEAAACGTPAIGTDTTGLRDSILQGKIGFLVPYGRPLALAEKIGEALEPEVWAGLSRNAETWASKFDWSNTLPQLESVVRDAIQGYGLRPSDKLRAVILSPRHKKCSAAYYSEKLGRAMNVEVCSHYDLKNVIGNDLIHVQFEYNYAEFKPFGLSLIPYLIMLKLLRRRVVLTLHCVYSLQDFKDVITTSFYKVHPFKMDLAKVYIYFLTKTICSLANVVIVLNNKAKQILESEYGIRKVVHIEFCSYGVCEKDLISKEEAKDKLGLSGRVALFSFGELHPRKQYELVISILPMLKKRYPNILYIISKVLPSTNSRKGQKYLEWINELVDKLDVRENVIFVDYIPDKELKYYFRASDAVIFCHRPGGYGSAAVKHAMSYLTTCIVSDVPCFQSLKDGIHCFKFSSRKGLFQKVVKVIEEKPSFERGLRQLIEDLSIRNHAKKHLDVYSRILFKKMR